ncbi:MAG TPA: glycine oxidase ThiO [Candidatus Sulfotelmatobacter sp.]|nr:glycine oxidase ThiO [Candidatus Sulfotelmatobacter sp.]
MNSWDVIIAGGGIIGVSLALELRNSGAEVLVLERGEPGRQASSAAAGMLAATDPETPPALRALALASAQMFPEYVRKLEELSGISTDFRRQGTIALGEPHEVPANYKKLAAGELENLEPWLHTSLQPAFFVQEDSVDPRLLMQAAVAAAQNRGVELHSNLEIAGIRGVTPKTEVVTAEGTFSAGVVVNCRGAWSGAPVRPRKGQMLYLKPARSSLLQHVIRAPEVYIVPRSSGKILVGATVEDVGFDTTVEPSTIESLFKAAVKYLPELEAATVMESWAGLRPGTPDDLPILGATGIPHVFIASGHFRNGILLAPITAKIMAEIVTGKPPSLAIDAFAASRFAPGQSKSTNEP